jgi:hypothetical protein
MVLRLLLASLLLVCLARVRRTSAVQLQFVAQFAANCSASAGDDVFSRRANVLASFFKDPQYGEYDDVEVGESLEGGESKEAAGGADRRLNLGSCPAKCETSNSAVCRSLGCARCGRRCGRRLLRRLEDSSESGRFSTPEVRSIESPIDTALDRFRGRGGQRKSCQIWITIFQIWGNGTATLLA